MNLLFLLFSLSALDVVRFDPFNAETPDPTLALETTPLQEVYVRTNFDIPLLAEDHVIEIGGAVNRPFKLSVKDLQKMKQRTVQATMECAGNDRLGMRPMPVGEPWNHGALSTVIWEGVSLADVLALAEPSSDAVEVLLTAADEGVRDDAPDLIRFARSLPIEVAMQKETLLALSMNGSPLTPAHGYPVRLAVPNWYGMASVKWITRIDVLTKPFEGFFQKKRYVYEETGGVTPVDRIRVKSIITSPADGAKLTSRNLNVSGWAWSGKGSITRVEVRIDSEGPWQEAELGAPKSPYSWTPWSIALSLPYGGRFALRSRATDASGTVQPDQIEWNRLGYGNNALRFNIIDVD